MTTAAKYSRIARLRRKRQRGHQLTQDETRELDRWNQRVNPRGRPLLALPAHKAPPPPTAEPKPGADAPPPSPSASGVPPPIDVTAAPPPPGGETPPAGGATPPQEAGFGDLVAIVYGAWMQKTGEEIAAAGGIPCPASLVQFGQLGIKIAFDKWTSDYDLDPETLGVVVASGSTLYQWLAWKRIAKAKHEKAERAKNAIDAKEAPPKPQAPPAPPARPTEDAPMSSPDREMLAAVAGGGGRVEGY